MHGKNYNSDLQQQCAISHDADVARARQCHIFFLFLQDCQKVGLFVKDCIFASR